MELAERFACVDDLVITEPPIQYCIDILEHEGKLRPCAVLVEDVCTTVFNPFPDVLPMTTEIFVWARALPITVVA
ncbi:hypothetical protein [Pseudomonas sp. PS02302]|uniref:hypothetical protein n=1 Tax=Pseudomonas sp. PS02302 TaxID=2991428 RepID=UPI00249C5B99|nr:hypothetical protein [Pseudomonas sp. PS02302]